MRDVYDGLQDLLAHTARKISEGLEDEYARSLDVMYFPQLVRSFEDELTEGIFGDCTCWRRWTTVFPA